MKNHNTSVLERAQPARKHPLAFGRFEHVKETLPSRRDGVVEDELEGAK